MLAHIERLADGNSPPTQKEIKNDPDAPATTTYQSRFGCWNNAVEEAGFNPRVSHTYTSEDVVNHIKRLSVGNLPPKYEYFTSDPDTPSKNVIQSHFGDWGSALEEAGFEAPSRGKNRIRDVRLAIVREVVDLAKNGVPPTKSKYRSMETEFEVKCVTTVFDSWGDMLQAAGFEPDTNRGCIKADRG